MSEAQHERVADVVRRELPLKSISTLLAVNLVIMLLTVAGYNWQRKQDQGLSDHKDTQAVWNANFRGQLEGLKATVEFGPRIMALEQGQLRQTAVLEAIALKLGIEFEESQNE